MGVPEETAFLLGLEEKNNLGLEVVGKGIPDE